MLYGDPAPNTGVAANAKPINAPTSAIRMRIPSLRSGCSSPASRDCPTLARAKSNSIAAGEADHRASDGDDDLPLRVAVPEVPVRVGDVVELVATVDHRPHLAGLD